MLVASEQSIKQDEDLALADARHWQPPQDLLHWTGQRKAWLGGAVEQWRGSWRRK